MTDVVFAQSIPTFKSPLQLFPMSSPRLVRRRPANRSFAVHGGGSPAIEAASIWQPGIVVTAEETIVPRWPILPLRLPWAATRSPATLAGTRILPPI